MEEMRDEKEEGDKEEQQQKPRKTFPKSPVDDKFFRYVNDSVLFGFLFTPLY